MEAPVDISQLQACGHAVAGHAGTMQDPDGNLFIKPCTKQELDFYQAVYDKAKEEEVVEEELENKFLAEGLNPEAIDARIGDWRDENPDATKWRDLKSIMPEFMGSLSLSGSADLAVSELVAAVVGDTGDADKDKEQAAKLIDKQEQEQEASETIPEEWVPTNGGKISTDKAIVLGNSSVGYKHPNILDLKLGKVLYAPGAPEKKKLKMDKLSAETTHAKYGFRIAGMKTFRGSTDESQLNEEEYMVYDKEYGRTLVNNDTLVNDIGKFLFNKRAGIDEPLAKAVCRAISQEVERVETILSRIGVTMFSASLLIVVEGEGKALRTAIKQHNTLAEALDAGEPSTVKLEDRVDSGIALQDEDDDEDELGYPPTWSVNLIDFAHASFLKDDSGNITSEPDSNFMDGIRSVKEIFAELGREA